MPGKEQEARGIVQAGRAMLDSIIDLRTPRFLLILRNAFGGAYASFNNYPTGADLVIALPTTRLAVMGPAGVEFVYKKELRTIRASVPERIKEHAKQLVNGGSDEMNAVQQATEAVQAWQQHAEAELAQRYEREIMNPNEALSLGSISELVFPAQIRQVLAEQMACHLRHYLPKPMGGIQREFH